MHRRDCSRPCLVQLWLLALHHQTRNSTFRTGRDDRSQKFTPRFSHRFRSRRLVERIPARPARSNQGRGVPPGWITKNEVVLRFKGGVEAQILAFPWTAPPYSRGGFDFNGQYTSIPNVTDGSTGRAQFL